MPHLVIMCLALAAALFGAIVTLATRAQMRIKDPEQDGYFKLRKDFGTLFEMNDWAEFHSSGIARTASFVIALLFTLVAVLTAIWHGAQAIL